jgi:D-arginine dehydrogenase
METCQVAVIGGGLAGASTAYHLTRLGVRDVLVLEQEAMPGLHSSGRNAAMARQTAVPDAVRPLAEEGVRFLTKPPDDLGEPPLLRPCGMLLLAQGARAARLAAAANTWLGREEVEERVPVTKGGAFDGAVWGADDGVVDVARLLRAFLRAASRGGARFLPNSRVTAIEVEGGRIRGLRAGALRVAAGHVVDAAGAWAADVAALAGAGPFPLKPCRRHLFLSGPLDGMDRDWPIVWDLSHDFYFRPEGAGLLLSPCDETPWAPGLPPTDAAASSALASQLASFMPRLSDLLLARAWAGLRVLTPDGAFVLGRDEQVEGFVWCAGLGGHGMTTSPAVGRVAAEAVLGAPPPPEHAPGRLAPVQG